MRAYATRVEAVATGLMLVFFLGRLIAVVDRDGTITWRDEHFPLFFVSYLIEFPEPQYQWN